MNLPVRQVARTASATFADPPVRRYVDHVMGMPISLALRGRHTADARATVAWTTVLAELHVADAMFSTYRCDSYVCRLNAREMGVDDCPPQMAEVLALAERARQESGGAFDVYRSDPDGLVTFDPSGVVKGWAVERAAAALSALPDTDFCLSAGGDMVCRVASRSRPAWRIGIEDPHDVHRLVAVVDVRAGAVATSGLAHRGAHVVDARTGGVPAGVASVTVVANSLTEADIDATAGFALGRGAVSWLRTRHGRRGVVVWDDGTREVFTSTRPLGQP